MAEASRVFATSAVLTHKGQPYTLAPITLEMLCLFEAWLEARAYAKVHRRRGQIAEADYLDQLDSVTRSVNAGTFAYSGTIARQAAVSEEGKRYLVYLELASNHGMTEALANEILDTDWDGIITRANQLNGDADPNPTAPATA